MPRNAPAPKKAAVAGYGGTILECEPTLPAREATLAALVERKGARIVHPYDDARVIAGQATCAWELIEDAPGLDAVVAPIGGGGLISGTCLALSKLSPDTKVYAAEPERADDAFRSLAAGRILEVEAPDTIADGLKVSLRARTWHFVSRDVAGILLVSEDAIVAAMRLIWERMKIVVEPSSAVALAAVLANAEVFAGKRVGIILTGGNVDLDRLPWH